MKKAFGLGLVALCALMTNGCGDDNGSSSCTAGEVRCSGNNVRSVCTETSEWKDETCEYGCDVEAKSCIFPDSCKDGATKCADASTQATCKSGEWKNTTCDLGCDSESGTCIVTEKCTLDATQCNEGNTAVLKCNANGEWVDGDACELGCNDGKCKQCATEGEKSCSDAGNVQTCQSDFTLKETETCELGCNNGKCKACAEVGSSTCSNGRLHVCQPDFEIKEIDCSTIPGWQAGTCSNNACEASACKTGYLLKGKSCTLEIPFAGNVFVTEMENNDDIIEKANNIISDSSSYFNSWKNPKETLSFYFAPKRIGELKLFVDASLPTGTTSGKLSFTYEGVTHEITVDGAETKLYEVGTWEVKAPGYVKIDIKGTSVTPENAEFARVSTFYIAGDVAAEMPNCTTKDVVEDAYWNRRGPSVHMWYTMPNEDVEWFYNEVIVPEGSDIINSYFMLTGFDGGYMGIQVNSKTERNVLFSVWSAYNTDDPNQIPVDYQVTTLRKGENVEPQPFGDEGSGMQSFYTYPWVTGKPYKTLVHIRPAGNNATDFTGYFCDEKGTWHLLASFRRPKTDTWYKGAYSFLENYNPAASIYSREVHFTNPWMRTRAGKWIEITEAQYTADTAGTKGYRLDRMGASSGSEFILRNCGFFVGTGKLGEVFARESSGKPAPEIDFDALEKL